MREPLDAPQVPSLHDRCGPSVVASCCAAAYGSEWARLLLGDAFHPGGLTLTDRVADLLDIGPDSRVLDVAAGIGTTAIHLAATRGCAVVGIELSAANVAEASRRARSAGVRNRVDFHCGSVESWRGWDSGNGAGFDAAICECAFCTFVDKPAAAAAMARALRPGGRLGVSDLTRNVEIPVELEGLLAWVACIAGALPIGEYQATLCDAGLRVDGVEVHDDALLAMADTIRGRLVGAGLLVGLGRMPPPPVDLDDARRMARVAMDAIRQGRLGYAVLSAIKPG